MENDQFQERASTGIAKLIDGSCGAATQAQEAVILKRKGFKTLMIKSVDYFRRLFIEKNNLLPDKHV